MSACIICGKPCPPSKTPHLERLLCSPECKRLRSRDLRGRPRELVRPRVGGHHRERDKALKTLRQACVRRGLQLTARTEPGVYVVEVSDGRLLHVERGEPLAAIAAAKSWLYEARPSVTEEARQVRAEERYIEKLKAAQVEQVRVPSWARDLGRRDVSDYAWGSV